MKKYLIGSALALFCQVNISQAAIIQYNDLTSFNAALTAGTTTLETFDDAMTGLLTLGDERLFDGFGFSYTNAPNSNQRAGIYSPTQINLNAGTAINNTNSVGWGEYLNGGYIDGGDGPNIVFRFFAPITAFAFDFSDSDWSDSYSVRFDTEAPFALGVASRATEFISFFGFVSTEPFSTITFSQTATGGVTETFSIDNIRTNGFRTPEDAAAVSAPASIGLFGLSLFALMMRRRASRHNA